MLECFIVRTQCYQGHRQIAACRGVYALTWQYCRQLYRLVIGLHSFIVIPFS